MTTNRKNQYEELIDQMMIDEVAGIDSDIKNTLEGLETDKKRMAILSILDDNRDLFLKIKRIVDEQELTKTQHIKEVVKMLREYVVVGEVEKKKFGEVMTPISLVEDMMDTLPKDVWSNPDLKWLDPCSGVGIFSCVVVDRLMEGLKDAIADEEQRYAHIMENMIHVGELQPKNMFLFLCAFDPKDEFELNVYTGSFLEDDFDKHAKNVWGLDKFDVVVMNPPYQEQKPGFKKTQPLWHLFVQKTIAKLSEGGYLSAVHPSGWRNVDGVFKKTQQLMLSKQIINLNSNTFKEGIRVFGAKTDFDFYCLKNTSPYTETQINTQEGVEEVVDISNMEFIPNGMFKEVMSLLAKEGEDKVEVLHSYSTYETRKNHMSKVQDDEFKYPCVYTTTKDNKVNLWFSEIKKGHFGIPKVFWSNGYSTSVHIDKKAEFGLTQFSYAIVDDVDNLENIKKAMDSIRFRKILRPVDDGCSHKYNRKIIALFRKDFWKEFVD